MISIRQWLADTLVRTAAARVVAAVNAFETASGVRPPYEIYDHSWMHDLRWLLLIPPGLLSSALGRQIGMKLLA